MDVISRDEEEINKKTNEFAERFVNLLKDKANVDSDIKALKDEFKLEGVAVGKVVKVVNKIKRDMKTNAIEAAEQEKLEDMISENEDVKIGINDLVSGV